MKLLCSASLRFQATAHKAKAEQAGTEEEERSGFGNLRCPVQFRTESVDSEFRLSSYLIVVPNLEWHLCSQTRRGKLERKSR